MLLRKGLKKMDTNGQLYFKYIRQPFFGLILHFIVVSLTI